MNSYINLIFDAEGAEERLQRLFQSAPEQSAADFLNSRPRSGADRAHKHLVSAEIGFSVWLGSPSFPFLLVLCVSRRARLNAHF
jgi:hypothetical protein